MTHAATEPSPVPSLLSKLERFELDDPAASLPFSARLARDNGWDRPYAERVAREYLRFVFLAMEAGHPVTPSESVDQAWHLHLVYTRSYWEEMCGSLLQRPLHHGPTKGGAAEGAKFRDWYSATLDSYRRLVGEEPPADIWPETRERFARAGKQQWVDRGTHWIVRKPRWRFRPDLARRAPAFVSLTAAALVAWLGLSSCVPAAGMASGTTVLPGVLLVTLLAGASIIWIRAAFRTERRNLEGGLSPGSARTVDFTELARLKGDRRRALVVAAAGLLLRNCIRVDSSRFFVSRAGESGLLPLEASVYNCLADSKYGSRWSRLTRRMSDGLRTLESGLAARGLLPPHGARTEALWRLTGVMFLCAAICWTAGFAVLGGKFAFTSGLFLICGILVAVQKFKEHLPEVTAEGRRARPSRPATDLAATGGPAAIMLSVALHGETSLPGELDALHKLCAAPPVKNNNTGCRGCTGSGCSGSGCGSGCGGGCGGGCGS